jgi:hypothetical protein
MGQLLVAEIRKRERVSVLDSGELRALAGGGGSTAVDARGCSEAECFAEVADALGADAVVVAVLTNIEGQILFGLRRVDPKKQVVAASFLERVPAEDTNALLPLVGKSVGAAFEDVPLRPGQEEGVDERAAQLMNPPPLPPVLSGSLYAGAGVSALAAGASFATAAGAWLGYVGEYEKAKARSPGAAEAADENAILAPLADAYGLATTTGVIALGAAALFGVSAVVTGAFTDWEGYGSPDAEGP